MLREEINFRKLLFLIESLLTIKAWILLMACMWVLLVPMVLRWYSYSANMVIGMVLMNWVLT
ncbi:hypothetical protein GW17_00020579 [Ensete ventricosum]|nr:hypothetical protein GW17_00020579 [Ensete ventricosum]RZS05049.1 hypothetical protein BHM03_00035483 [Ensete ventricosum]